MAKLKFGKWTYSEDELNRQLAEATVRGEMASRTEPRVVSAAYDDSSRRIVLELDNDTSFAFPIYKVEGLGGAPLESIAEVSLVSEGTALRWEHLDIDLGVVELIAGIYGTHKWMAKLGRKGGSARSEAKAIASRENGKKGGRPKRSTSIRAGSIEHSSLAPRFIAGNVCAVVVASAESMARHCEIQQETVREWGAMSLADNDVSISSQNDRS